MKHIVAGLLTLALPFLTFAGEEPLMFNCLDPENTAKTIDVEIHPNDFVMYIFEEGENTYADAEERNFSKGELLVAENDEDPSWWQVELDETVISPECTPVGDATEQVMKVFNPLEW